MQKHANEKEYSVIFEPSLLSADMRMRCDAGPISLPVGEIPYLHCHSCLEIGLCCGGEGLFLCNDCAETVSAGDVILIFPPAQHYSRSLNTTAPCQCRFAYFDYKPLLCTLLGSLTEEYRPDVAVARGAHVRGIPPILREREYPEAVALLRRLAQTAFDVPTYRDELCAFLLCEFLLNAPEWFGKFRVEYPSEDTGAVCEDDGISMVATYLSLHYAEHISSAMLAAMCHLSESQLRRRFRRRYQLSPVAYLNRLRCRIGAELLRHTDMTVTAISDKIGYENPSDFYRHFVSHTGLSPSEFRKQNT